MCCQIDNTMLAQREVSHDRETHRISKATEQVHGCCQVGRCRYHRHMPMITLPVRICKEPLVTRLDGAGQPPTAGLSVAVPDFRRDH